MPTGHCRSSVLELPNKKTTTRVDVLFGTPGGTRTPGLDVRTVLLYPAELLGPDHTIKLHGAGWGSRNPVLSLENLYISRYTNPAATLMLRQQSRLYHILQLVQGIYFGAK